MHGTINIKYSTSLILSTVGYNTTLILSKIDCSKTLTLSAGDCSSIHISDIWPIVFLSNVIEWSIFGLAMLAKTFVSGSVSRNCVRDFFFFFQMQTDISV